MTADAATFVRDAADGSFGAAFVDFQESATVPKSYFAVGFWIDLARVVRLDGAIVLNVTEGLWKSTDWNACTAAQLEAGLEVVAISAPLPSGNRTLISKARKPGGFSGPVGDGDGLATDCETDLSTASHPMERPSPSGPSR
ncbi:hypothetical protein [Phenylobacterium sp.]|uniref:hypothetical protein n=1 Tax=Phenylobacterium sp. TaxID=1871053 RepID=UPI003BAA21B8